MKYKTYIEAVFLKREKRFITYCRLNNGTVVIAHLPNTGRCAELLIEGVKVFLEHNPQKTRKTNYTLYMVKKGERFINIDSQAPNKIVKEALEEKSIIFERFGSDNYTIKSEYTYGNSRFDFYLESNNTKMLIEVKGVTLESENIVSFPDAPSIRAVKHIQELILAKKKGIEGCIIFLVQMEEPVKKFIPNVKAQEKIHTVLKKAKRSGILIRSYSSKINRNEIKINRPVIVELDNNKTS